jgi:hypothetical protein
MPERKSPDPGRVGPADTSLWIWLSIAAVLLALAGNAIALLVPGIYARLTPAFLPQALAQDVASLALVSPAWLIVAVLALRGSVRAYLLWLGVLVFTVYNYVIYTFAVPFGPLFLLWVAVFGLSLFALIGGAAAADHEMIQSNYTSRAAARATGWFLIVVAVLFALLWLSEDLPALLRGVTPQSVKEMGVPTNPVHILDLSFFLPAVIITGVMLLRGRALGYTAAPAFLVFLILTGIPILLTPLVQTRSGQPASWGAVPPIGTLTLITLGFLVWVMSTIRGPKSRR